MSILMLVNIMSAAAAIAIVRDDASIEKNRRHKKPIYRIILHQHHSTNTDVTTCITTMQTYIISRNMSLDDRYMITENAN